MRHDSCFANSYDVACFLLDFTQFLSFDLEIVTESSPPRNIENVILGSNAVSAFGANKTDSIGALWQVWRPVWEVLGLLSKVLGTFLSKSPKVLGNTSRDQIEMSR